MKQDHDGFIIPVIDSTKCVNCGLCKKSCPIAITKEQADTHEGWATIHSYAVIANDSEMLARSSSGGAFGVLAKTVLSNDGVVFGAAYDEKFHVTQIMIESPNQIFKLQSSKYIQSSVNDTFIEAKIELEKGRLVLYTGTPCQIAGLRAYLKKDYTNLLTVDLLCHGVPNQKLFSNYIDYMENKHKAKIIAYSFRDKMKWGWGNWGSVCFSKPNKKNKIKYFPVDSDYYYSLYFKENCFRESCYVCPFAKLPRQGDFTIGDFWGADQLLTSIPYRNGVSLMLVNSQKAEKILCQTKPLAQIIPCELKVAVRYNQTAVRPTVRPKSRDTLYLDLTKYGFEEAAKRYCKISYIMPVINRYIPRRLKYLIKLILKKVN